MLLFLLPHIQQATGFMKERPLNGHFKTTEKIDLTFEGWFSLAYQDSVEKFLQSHIPLKPSFIRLRNQLDYSLFGKLHVRDVHSGKGGQLFRYTHYFTYGGNYPGDAKIEENVNRLKNIQNKLKQEGKILIFVFAADKLWYHKELLSDPEAVMNEKSTHLYTKYRKELLKNKCDFIDFNQSFLTMKDTVKGVLFGKGGYHWSEYAGFLAMDSIVKYVRSFTDIKTNSVQSVAFEKNNIPWFLDHDIYDACNLQFSISDDDLYYHPKPEFTKSKSVATAILTGDSFCRSLCWNPFFAPYFSQESTFWYYNREVYDYENKLIGNPKDEKSQELIKKSDIYIVLYSPGNLESFEYGFLDHFQK